MDTTSFVFGPQPPERASARWFKNVSLLWKVAGAVLLSLMVCLFILWFASLATFRDVRTQFESNVETFCQRGSDVMLAVLHGLYKVRIDEVARGVEAVERTWNSSKVEPTSAKMKEHVQLAARRLTFLSVLDESRKVIANYIVTRKGNRTFVDSRKASSRPFTDSSIFRKAWQGKTIKGTLVLNADDLSRIGLTKQATVADSKVDGLALVSLRRCIFKNKRYLILGGYLLNNSQEFIEKVRSVIYNVRRWDKEHTGAHEAAISVSLGTTFIATTKPEHNALGYNLALPENVSKKGDMAVWRGETKMNGKTFVSSLTPIIDLTDHEVGFLSISVDLDHFMAPYRKAFFGLRSDYRSNMGLAVFVALVMAFGVGFLAARLIIWPLALLTQFTAEVAAGRLNVAVTLDGKDEIGVLASSFRNMVKNLRALTRRIEDATVQLGEATHQLSTNLSSQAATSAQQTVAVKGTSVTLEELASASRQIADSALAVVKAAAKTLESANRGRESSQATIKQMARIQHANEDDLARIAALSGRIARIDEIMALINTIADQTKLIAFNAAIEAAAAGEAGRRFTVVSEEIRRLAENVLDRALEIRTSISDVQEAAKTLVSSRQEGSAIVGDGVEITERTSTDLSEILEDTKSVLQDSKQISMSTQQQRAATEQSLSAIREIEEGVIELAEGTKRTEEVVARLSSLATNLQESVERFELEGVDEEVAL